jgi:uncharacterized protein YdhG (YjbR/CyaY superfamily)
MAETPKHQGFTADEKAAMKERSTELKNQAKKADGEKDLLAKIAEMSEPDRSMAERIHALVTRSAPTLSPKTWYGQPAYAKGDRVVVFFQAADKFKTRYATLGFSDTAALDDGSMWPTSFAITSLTKDDETRIAELVRRAAG